MIRLLSALLVCLLGATPALASCDETRLVEIIRWCAMVDNIQTYADSDAEASAVYRAIRFGQAFGDAEGTAGAMNALEHCHRNNPDELIEIDAWRSCDETRFIRAITLALPAR